MRVLFTTDTLKRGGKERQLTLLAGELNVRNFDTKIYSLELTASNHYLDEYHVHPDLVYVANQKGYWDGFWEFREWLQNHRFDIIMAWDMKTAFWCFILSPFCDFVFINGTIRHGLRKRKLSHLFRSWIARQSQYVIANSMAGLNTNKIKYRANRTFVVYNGIKPRMECPSRLDLKKKILASIIGHEFDSSAIVFLSVANLLPYKDHKTVIEVLSKLKEKIPFYFLIIGEGPMKTELQSKIDELGIQNQVKLLGRRSDVNEFMNMADLFIHSSVSEGCSNAIIEAMSAGLPVIATNVGGTPEIIFEKTCKLFSLGDHQELLHLLSDCRRLIDESKVHHIEYSAHCGQFNQQRMIDAFCGIFVKCLGQN
jgi:glycosyltransferase involved in cell wall biosynthesis